MDKSDKRCAKHILKTKIMLRKILKDLNEWRDTSCLWVRRYNIVVRSVIPKLIDHKPLTEKERGCK